MKIRTVLLAGMCEDPAKAQKVGRELVRRRHRLFTDPSYKAWRRSLKRDWDKRNREAIREYQREWRKANPEMHAEQLRRYAEAHREERKAYHRWYYENVRKPKKQCPSKAKQS